MDYEYDIFVSYGHGDDDWSNWVQNTFVPQLKGQLNHDWGEHKVFIDNEIATGARWEGVLKTAVARSRIMIPVISARYFEREWCKRELSLMFEREEKLKTMKVGDNYGLILPIMFGGEQFFPELIKSVQYEDFIKYRNSALGPGTPRWDEFIDDLRKFSGTIVETLKIAPNYSNTWETFTGDSFYSQLDVKPLAKKVTRINP